MCNWYMFNALTFTCRSARACVRVLTMLTQVFLPLYIRCRMIRFCRTRLESHGFQLQNRLFVVIV